MNDDATVLDHLRVVARQWWIVAMAVAIGVGGALVVDVLGPPAYESRAEVRIDDPNDDPLFEPEGPAGLPEHQERELETQARVLGSDRIRDGVDDELGGRAADVSTEVRPLPDTNVLVISSTSADRELARRASTLFVEHYLSDRRNAALTADNERRDALWRRADLLTARMERYEAAVLDERRALAGVGLPGSPRLQGLETTRASLATQVNELSKRAEELDLQARVTNGGVELVSGASTPADPISPRPLRDAAVGLLLGLFVGVVLALLRGAYDDRIRVLADLDRVTDLPVLGCLPVVEGGHGPVGTEPALATVCRHLGALRAGGAWHRLVVAPPTDCEWAGATALALVRGFAEAGPGGGNGSRPPPDHEPDGWIAADLVVTAGPPLLPVPSLDLIGAPATGLVVVAEAGRSRRREVLRALRATARLGAPAAAVLVVDRRVEAPAHDSRAVTVAPHSVEATVPATTRT